MGELRAGEIKSEQTGKDWRSAERSCPPDQHKRYIARNDFPLKNMM
jgi:hypothetical protein